MQNHNIFPVNLLIRQGYQLQFLLLYLPHVVLKKSKWFNQSNQFLINLKRYCPLFPDSNKW